MKKYKPVLLCFLLFASCQDNEMSSLGNLIEYRLISFESEQEQIESGDIVYTRIEFITADKPSKWESEIFVANSKSNRLSGALMNFSKGDSLEMIIQGRYFYPSSERRFALRMKIDSIVKKERVKFLRHAERLKIERAEINHYLHANGYDANCFRKGLYFLDEDHLQETKLRRGDPLELHFQTWILDGNLVSSQNNPELCNSIWDKRDSLWKDVSVHLQIVDTVLKLR